MADVSVNSAALDKLSASLEGQTIALKALTESNQRAILQKDETVNIKGVQTRGGGTRPYDEVTANAIATGNQPLVDALNKDKEPGILSKLLKGILIGGAGYLIYQAITKAPELKAIFDKGVNAVKKFLVGENGILNRAYDFLFADGEGEDAGIIRRVVRAMKNVFEEGSFLDTVVTSLAKAIQSVGTFFEDLFSQGEGPKEGLFTKILRIMRTSFKDGSFLDTVAESVANGVEAVANLFVKVKKFFTGEDLPLMEKDLPFTERVYNEMVKLYARARTYLTTVLYGSEGGKEGLIPMLKRKFFGFIDEIEAKLTKSINNILEKTGLKKFVDLPKTIEQQKNVANAYMDGAKEGFMGSAPMRARAGIIDKGSDLLAKGLYKLGGGKQQGGSVMAGMGYTIGEDGPETFIPGGNGTILPNIVKPIQKLGDDIVTELSSGSIVRGLDSLGDKMDNLAASMAGGSGVVTVPGAEGPGTNYNGVYEQRSLVR